MMRPFEVRMDMGYAIQNLLISGAVLAYVAVVFNIFVFLVLCRKNLVSPATILMQGLAISDGFTSLFAYGLEPLFLRSYKPVSLLFQSDLVELKYPICALYVHFRYCSGDFHFVSLLLTTCIGIQKCIALRFPIWTKLYLTNKKAIIVCVLCFVISVGINVPRHFGIEFHDDDIQHFSSECSVREGPVISYTLVGHLIISTVFTGILCITMTFCTGYIIYKLKTNTFKGRQTTKSKLEKRSVIMVMLVLVIFLISEIPTILMYASMVSDAALLLEKSTVEELITLIMDERFRFAIIMQYAFQFNFDTCLIFAEFKNIFILGGCISNFLIYTCTSEKMRDEIRTAAKCRKRK